MDAFIYCLIFIFLNDNGLCKEQIKVYFNLCTFDRGDILRGDTEEICSSAATAYWQLTVTRKLCRTNTRQLKNLRTEMISEVSKLKRLDNTLFDAVTGHGVMIEKNVKTGSKKSTDIRMFAFLRTNTRTDSRDYQTLMDVSNSTVVEKSHTELQSNAIKPDDHKMAVVTKVKVPFNETLSQLCDKGWHYFQNSCYWFSDPSDTRSWQDARDNCRGNFSAHLLELNSDEELEFVLSKISVTPDSVWVGASYSLQDNMFQWGHSKAPVQWDYWSTGALGGGREHDSCVFLTKWKPIKTLSSAYCGIKQRFVCEKRANYERIDLTGHIDVASD